MIRNVFMWLEKSVQENPDKIAYKNDVESLTFMQVYDFANKIATALLDLDIIKSPIAVMLDKTPLCVATFLGIAASRNFYTPLDIHMPKERLEKICTTLKPRVVITCRSIKDIDVFSGGANVLYIEDIVQLVADYKEVEKVVSDSIDTDLLYVLFTSGSTGVPKGVTISHRAVIDYIEWLCGRFEFDSNTIFGNQAPLYFDLSIQDVYAPIYIGGSTYLINEKMFSSPVKMLKTICANGVNTIFWVPSALCLLVNMDIVSHMDCSFLKNIFFCGEVMPNRHLNVWRKYCPNSIFVNLYGPTEATEVCTYYIVDRKFADDEPLPIGRACENCEILILDENDNQIMGSEIGELCVRGTCLSNGYYNEAGKTKEVFIQNPLNSSHIDTIYRTGDLVKRNSRNEMLFVARKDYQIKHRGFRIELGEIEVALSSIEKTGTSCCLHDSVNDRLVIFWDGNIEYDEIIKCLKLMIPDYMLPEKGIRLKEMPHNLNGKIDRNGLKKYM